MSHTTISTWSNRSENLDGEVQQQLLQVAGRRRPVHEEYRGIKVPFRASPNTSLNTSATITMSQNTSNSDGEVEQQRPVLAWRDATKGTFMKFNHEADARWIDKADRFPFQTRGNKYFIDWPFWFPDVLRGPRTFTSVQAGRRALVQHFHRLWRRIMNGEFQQNTNAYRIELNDLAVNTHGRFARFIRMGANRHMFDRYHDPAFLVEENNLVESGWMDPPL
jgi:hypothetical protein